MSYKLKGKVKVISNTQNITDSFKKREFVILDESGQYPQTIQFEAVQDKCDMLDVFAEGESVEVFFNLRGKEWVNAANETKYFNSLNAWKIEKLESETAQENPLTDDEVEFEDDLPF